MEDHDQRLKNLFQLFFAELFDTFFPEWATRLDFTQPEWLDKEVFADPPAGRRRTLDLLARVPVRSVDLIRPGDPEEFLALTHIEIDSSERTTIAKRQLWESYAHLRSKHALPVLPVAIYLKVGLNGIGQDEHTETFGDLEVLRFRYLALGLPKLDALEYLDAKSLLAVALTPFMAMESAKAIEIGGQALERIANAELDDQRKYLLTECVEAYLPLTSEQQTIFEELQASPRSNGVKAMNVTTGERAYRAGKQDGLSEGLSRGISQGEFKTLLKIAFSLLTTKFGSLAIDQRAKVESLDAEQLEFLTKNIITSSSIDEALRI